MKTIKADSYWVRIYVAGPLNIIEQTCREYVTNAGLCVTVSPTKYIYVGGEENGVIVELINYARFPASADDIWTHAKTLANKIISESHQGSYTLLDDRRSVYHSIREDLKGDR